MKKCDVFVSVCLSRFGITKFMIKETLWSSIIIKTIMVSLHTGKLKTRVNWHVLCLQRRWYYCWLRNPNQGSPTQHEWPKYTIDERRVLVLDTSNPLRPQTGLRDRHCHFWSESVPALLPATDADSSGVSFRIQDAPCDVHRKISTMVSKVNFGFVYRIVANTPLMRYRFP